MLRSTLTSASTYRVPIEGEYQRKLGHQRVYAYSGAYGAGPDGAWWIVSVKWNGRPKGTPMGTAEGLIKPSARQIRDFIEQQIEDLVQVEE